MTETTILDQRAVSEIAARAKAATPGPWAVWDSCSWRRIGTVEPFRDGNVICPITQNDGHPDLLAKREDLDFVAHAREDIPALCATVKHLRERLAHDSQILDECEILADRFLHDENALPRDFPSASEIIDALLKRMGALRAENKRSIEVTTHAYNEERESLQFQLEQLRADVDKFSTLADERHDLLSAERRANDSLRQHVDESTRTNEKLTARNVELRQQLAQVEQERDELRTQLIQKERGDFDWKQSRP